MEPGQAAGRPRWGVQRREEGDDLWSRLPRWRVRVPLQGLQPRCHLRTLCQVLPGLVARGAGARRDTVDTRWDQRRVLRLWGRRGAQGGRNQRLQASCSARGRHRDAGGGRGRRGVAGGAGREAGVHHRLDAVRAGDIARRDAGTDFRRGYRWRRITASSSTTSRLPRRLELLPPFVLHPLVRYRPIVIATTIVLFVDVSWQGQSVVPSSSHPIHRSLVCRPLERREALVRTSHRPGLSCDRRLACRSRPDRSASRHLRSRHHLHLDGSDSSTASQSTHRQHRSRSDSAPSRGHVLRAGRGRDHPLYEGSLRREDSRAGWSAVGDAGKGVGGEDGYEQAESVPAAAEYRWAVVEGVEEGIGGALRYAPWCQPGDQD